MGGRVQKRWDTEVCSRKPVYLKGNKTEETCQIHLPEGKGVRCFPGQKHMKRQVLWGWEQEDHRKRWWKRELQYALVLCAGSVKSAALTCCMKLAGTENWPPRGTSRLCGCQSLLSARRHACPDWRLRSHQVLTAQPVNSWLPTAEHTGGIFCESLANTAWRACSVLMTLICEGRWNEF